MYQAEVLIANMPTCRRFDTVDFPPAFEACHDFPRVSFDVSSELNMPSKHNIHSNLAISNALSQSADVELLMKH